MLLVALFAACAGVQQRFPDDVQASLAHGHVMRLETPRFIIYYPQGKRDEVDRFLEHADYCVDELLHDAPLALDEKIQLAMPDTPYDNAFVLPGSLGYYEISVVPLQNTLDFTTEFGLPPDPGYVACHELTHYVHFAQHAGVWKTLNKIFGPLWSPQNGFDAWFFEGLATHYESALQPGVGRPRWPIFTGMFAAAYAGERLDGGELSEYGRRASVGQHYLVGAMFLRFLTERYGDRAVWESILSQAHAFTGLFFTGAIEDGYGKTLGTLLDEFRGWTRDNFPVRTPPANQKHLGTAGNDARYARRGDVDAWIGDDLDKPVRLYVRRGAEIQSTNLVEIIPPRKLVQADPLLVSGFSITDSGDVWFTIVDQGRTYNETRAMRWHDGALSVEANDLGPGVAISPDGRTYYFAKVDGDRWSLAALDLATHATRVIHEMAPGQYVLGGQASNDRIVANVWDGHAFVAWVISVDGKLERTIGAGYPIYDASFTSDGRVLYLGEVAGRFQAMIDGVAVTDAPYAVLAPREANGTIRFLDREKWEWELAEVPLPQTTPSPTTESPAPPIAWRDIPILADAPYCAWNHVLYPTLRAPTFLSVSSGQAHVGAVIGGGDPLGMQRWQLAGYLQPASKVHLGATLDYMNLMLAPVAILASASIIDWEDPVDGGDPIERRTRDVAISATRIFRNSLQLTVGGLYTDDYDSSLDKRRHLGGPQLSLLWVGGESTPYTELRRGVTASLEVADYPSALSSLSVRDYGGSLTGVAPLTDRLIATLGVRGRAITGAPGLLQLGGDSGLTELYSHGPTTPSLDFPLLPPNLQFVEALRGYEDYGIATDRVAIADLNLRYPLIIDRGVASIWRLPATFIRELDVELFAAAARDGDRRDHAAAGGALSLRLALFRVPLLVQYQLARRLRDDDALTHLVSLGPDF